ncbi:hypothetical protein K1T71_007057 [Dendrolimus kikuchii]|uniref:Uncharacterized protein n=1 Tax=Dendrolimus kikuchii TaxID=765133 RepID=A0ACC1CZI1_9NEOP|nr:hypothetical protein K1T71_007057 [Dendrolimus kikuchii]
MTVNRKNSICTVDPFGRYYKNEEQPWIFDLNKHSRDLAKTRIYSTPIVNTIYRTKADTESEANKKKISKEYWCLKETDQMY